MPRVPYEPYPTATPTQASPQVDIRATPEEFGANVGAAIRGLGGETEKVGSELFQRALDFQNLQNENDSRQAQTDYAIGAAKLHADFSAKTGAEATAALPKYLADQRQLRESIGAKLQSPMAKEMYDADSLPFMQRNIFNAAGHAAEQNKLYTIGTFKSVAQTNTDIIAQHADDEDYVNQQIDKIKGDTLHASIMESGNADPTSAVNKLAVDNAVSNARRTQVEGVLATGNYMGANALEQKYKGDFTAKDLEYVTNQIEFRGATVAAGNVASQVLAQHRQPDGTYDETVAHMQEEARGIVGKMLPNNSLAPDMVAQRIDGLSYSSRVAARIDGQDAQKKFLDTVTQYGVHDVQSLLALPDGPKIVAALPDKQKANLQSTINDFWKGSDRISSQESLRTINGMRTQGTQDSMADFMAINPSDPKWHLSTDDQIKVQNWQYEMAKKPTDDPRVGLALSVLKGARGPELQAMGIYNRDRNNPDDYDHFVGTLQEAIQVWQEDHGGKRPTNAEIQDVIGPEIIKTQATNKGYLWNSQEPAFRQFSRPSFEDIPEDWKTRVTNEVTKAGGIAPTDEQLIQAYARMQFNLLYKQSKPTGE